MQFNVIHLIYVVKCFPSNVILIANKNYMDFIFYFFSSQFLQFFKSSWKLYHLVVFVSKLWDDSIILVTPLLLLKLCKFRYLYFLEFFCLWKKVVLFIFLSVKEGLDATVLSSFLEKLMLIVIFRLIYFIIQHLEYIQGEVRYTVRVQQVSHFCHPAWFFVSSFLIKSFT